MPQAVVLALLAVILLATGSVLFPGKSSREWELTIRDELRADSRFTQVFPRVNGLWVRLHGIVAEPEDLLVLSRIVDHAFPMVRVVDIGGINLAGGSPWLRWEGRGGVLVLSGELSDPVLCQRLRATFADLGTLRDDLKFNPEVRRVSWGAEVIDFVPELAGVTALRGEIRDSSWTLSGVTTSRDHRDQLVTSWDALVPPEALMDLTGLRDQGWIPVRGLRNSSWDDTPREHWEAWSRSWRLD